MPAPTAALSRCGPQANGGGAWDALRSVISDHPVPATKNKAARLATQLPRLWTGFNATLMRDVPFSALYWAMMEPMRRALLPQREHLHLPHLQLHGEQAAAPGGFSGGGSSSSGGGGGSASVQQQQQQHFHHYAREVLVANMVSGAIAGGAAAAITTPFDVVKTRHQLMPAPAAAPAAMPVAVLGAAGHHPSCSIAAVASAGGEASLPFAAAAAGGGGGGAAAHSGRRSVWGTLREVYQQEGVGGLFTGVKPRAARAAPACAIVISCYELLKNALEVGACPLADQHTQ
jgi:solute carrier family 25 protein 39/40